ncbi:LTXXQ motif family protein [Collimonas arenae]|uniref:LTXXQ motif family protein n=1 Tax=Collimonas arenae TaxID=279058 RepID=A0A127QLP3_9BURK|nr:Spy/CpxP family protein refolding chaperone [Collimonas arenae]AMP01087.1 LTXXQ motif family protein [Collimonas arenae]AMP10981.1 LTXXQ motif family protein [Collimonas arenae]
MFTLRKQILIGVTALSFAAMGVTAYAQQADGPVGRHAPTPEQQAKFAANMAKRQAKLHDDLKITPDQEAAWQTFLGKIKPVRPEGAPPRPNKEEWAKQTAPERLDHQMEFLKRAEARLAEHTAAVKEFYAVLTPTQQKTFDEHFNKMMKHRFGHRGFHQGGPEGRP